MTKQEADKLKPLVEELSPKLNAYLKSIGPKPTTTGHGPLTTDNPHEQ